MVLVNYIAKQKPILKITGQFSSLMMISGVHAQSILYSSAYTKESLYSGFWQDDLEVTNKLTLKLSSAVCNDLVYTVISTLDILILSQHEQVVRISKVAVFNELLLWQRWRTPEPACMRLQQWNR